MHRAVLYLHMPPMSDKLWYVLLEAVCAELFSPEILLIGENSALHAATNGALYSSPKSPKQPPRCVHEVLKYLLRICPKDYWSLFLIIAFLPLKYAIFP